MAGFGYLCALALAALFVRAAAAKLARPREAAAGFGALGLPAAPALAFAVPAAELVTAALLVAAPTTGGLVAFLLLVAFTAVLATAVGEGRAVPCRCFGAASAEPVSPADLVRNALLEALAVGALLATRPIAPGSAAVPPFLALFVAGSLLLRAIRR